MTWGGGGLFIPPLAAPGGVPVTVATRSDPVVAALGMMRVLTAVSRPRPRPRPGSHPHHSCHGHGGPSHGGGGGGGAVAAMPRTSPSSHAAPFPPLMMIPVPDGISVLEAVSDVKPNGPYGINAADGEGGEGGGTHPSAPLPLALPETVGTSPGLGSHDPDGHVVTPQLDEGGPEAGIDRIDLALRSVGVNVLHRHPLVLLCEVLVQLQPTQVPGHSRQHQRTSGHLDDGPGPAVTRIADGGADARSAPPSDGGLRSEAMAGGGAALARRRHRRSGRRSRSRN